VWYCSDVAQEVPALLNASRHIDTYTFLLTDSRVSLVLADKGTMHFHLWKYWRILWDCVLGIKLLSYRNLEKTVKSQQLGLG
jgi:hypothetical protein